MANKRKTKTVAFIGIISGTPRLVNQLSQKLVDLTEDESFSVDAKPGECVKFHEIYTDDTATAEKLRLYIEKVNGAANENP